MGIRAATVLLLVAALLAGGAVAGAQDPSAGSPYELPEPPPEEPPAEPERPGAQPPRVRMLLPAPVVRISGRLTRRGATITRLQVKTPPLVRVVVKCKGKRKGCPRARTSALVPDSQRRVLRYRLKRFERTYRSGAVLTVLIARKGTVGKWARFKIRQGKAPKRRDACVLYGAARPRACTPPADPQTGGTEAS